MSVEELLNQQIIFKQTPTATPTQLAQFTFAQKFF